MSNICSHLKTIIDNAMGRDMSIWKSRTQRDKMGKEQKKLEISDHNVTINFMLVTMVCGLYVFLVYYFENKRSSHTTAKENC